MDVYSVLILALVFIAGVWIGYGRLALIHATEGEVLQLRAGVVARYAFLEFAAVVIMLILFAFIFAPNGLVIQYFVEYQAKFLCLPKDIPVSVMTFDGASVNYVEGKVVFKNNTTRLWPTSALDFNSSFIQQSDEYSELWGQPERKVEELMKKWNKTNSQR